MIFAIDIDGTIASVRGTNAYALYVNAVLRLSVSTEWKLAGGNSVEDQLLQEPQIAAWANSEERIAELEAVLKAGQYHPIVQQHALPIAGAVEGVNSLSKRGNILYITNRKPSTATVTQNWLEFHGFPHADRLYCCGEEKGFVSKLQYAASILLAEPEHGPLIFIDDRAATLEKSLQPLIKLGRDLVSRLLPHTAIFAYGVQEVSPCPFPLPVFPVAALPDWGAIDATLATTLPYIGKGSRQLACFLEKDVAPVALRRSLDPRVKQKLQEREDVKNHELSASGQVVG